MCPHLSCDQSPTRAAPLLTALRGSSQSKNKRFRVNEPGPAPIVLHWPSFQHLITKAVPTKQTTRRLKLTSCLTKRIKHQSGPTSTRTTSVSMREHPALHVFRWQLHLPPRASVAPDSPQTVTLGDAISLNFDSPRQVHVRSSPIFIAGSNAASSLLLKHAAVAGWKHRALSFVEQEGVKPKQKDRGAEQGDVDGRSSRMQPGLGDGGG